MTNHKFLLTVWFTFFNDLGGGLTGQSLHRIYKSSKESESKQGKRGSKVTFFMSRIFPWFALEIDCCQPNWFAAIIFH